MFRVFVALVVIVFFPLIAQAEEKTAGQHIEFQPGGEEQVIVTVSIEKQSGEVKISALHLKKEHGVERQKGELILSGSRETFIHRRRSRRRGK